MRWGPSFVVYRGPSAFDGTEILGVVTGADGHSNNKKTGPMAQLWILPANEVPHEAQARGADTAVCGDCTLRVPLNRGSGRVMCYVVTVQGPDHVWYKAHERGVDLAGCLDTLKASRAVLRLGAYGDPAALPQELVEALAGAASGVTGYTHAWRRPDAAWLRRYAMASVEDEAGLAEAQRAGWRTFRVLPREETPLDESEVMCVFKSHGTKCIDCGLCDGTRPDDKRKSVAIPAHGWPGRTKAMRTERAAARLAEANLLTAPPATLARAPRPGPEGVPQATPKPRKRSYREVSREEEEALIRRYQSGDNRAGAELIGIHIGLITKMVKRYANKGVDFDDLLQEGKMGFLKGVSRFAFDKGVKLNTYATWWVRHAVTRYLGDNASDIRVPICAQEASFKEGATEEKKLRAVRAKHVLRLDAPIGDEDGATLGDLTADHEPNAESMNEDEDAEERRRAILAKAITTLNAQQRYVMEARWLTDEPKTLEECGHGLGVTRERIRQIEVKAKAKLRQAIALSATRDDPLLWGGKVGDRPSPVMPKPVLCRQLVQPAAVGVLRSPDAAARLVVRRRRASTGATTDPSASAMARAAAPDFEQVKAAIRRVHPGAERLDRLTPGCFARLTDHLERVMRMLYVEGLDFAAVALKLNVSMPFVRKLEARAFRRLGISAG